MSESSDGNAEDDDASRAAELEQIAQDLEARILYRSESGAFPSTDSNRSELIHTIAEARENSDAGKFNAAREQLLEVSVALADVIRNKSFAWRATHIWGFIPFFYFLALGITTLYVMYRYSDEILEIDLLYVPFTAVLFAFLGGILRGLWWLSLKVQRKEFRPQFTMPYVAGPWTAIILGMLVYLIITSGLLLLTEESAALNEAALYTFVFIGGYSWEWVIELIERVKSGRQ